jgi:hypothetical protein
MGALWLFRADSSRTLANGEPNDTFGRMKRALPALLLALSACATSPAERPLSVRHVVLNAEALDGQEILVTGWVEECGHFGCPLWHSPREIGKEWPYRLSIAASKWFDRYADLNAPMRVTLRARFHDRCISDPVSQTIGVCTDRGSNLEPLSRVR